MQDIMAKLAEGGVALLGCGKMGGAMLDGWIEAGLPPASVTVFDTHPSPRVQELAAQGLTLNPEAAPSPAVCILSVKPQFMTEALAQVAPMAASGTLFVSVAAGLTLDYFAAQLGAEAKVIRTMPNTPAAVGKGVTAIYAPAGVGEAGAEIAEALLSAVGQTVRLESEDQIDAVTGVSGSGPAYVFHMIEALAAAGEAEGLAPELAMTLARATVIGAGALAAGSDESAAQLRINVTSPGGTTQAGLAQLMDPESGLPPLMKRTVAAAAGRSRELAG
ncbi:pyrroline-5-carboxylate reductase [Rhodovulum sp. DZ06]|uniref:pyrroline-5-carboxylate reductase n=1 Tax=Rhodovulum sp. DZ06 TaxID=3425126 RepID=UPI003D3270D1